MEIIVVSIKDRLANVHGQPMFFATTGTAIRAFQDAINDQQSNVSKHPDDYDLFQLGTYNDETGTFTNAEAGPKLLAVGKQLKNA